MPGIIGERFGNLKPGTPGRLLTWIAVPVLAVLACGLLLAASVGGLRGTLGVVGAQEEPEVVAASRLTYDLDSMDGHVADVLLLGGAAGLGESQTGAYRNFEKDRSDADIQLELLGSGIDTIPDGPSTFVSIEDQLAQYTQYVSYALYVDLETHNTTAAAGGPPAGVVQAYEHASTLMNQDTTGILAQAQFLYNAEQLAESAPVNGGLDTIWHLQLACGLLIAFIVLRLVVAQRRLSRAFRRTVNPLLALTTVTSLIFGVLLFTALAGAKTAYDAQNLTGPGSVSTLWQARATAANMHAAESRWVLQAESGGGRPTAAMSTEQDAFTSGAKWIKAIPQLPANASGELNSYLATERTLTSMVPGPGTVGAWTRALAAYDTGDSATAYAAFDTDLAKVIDTDQQAFSSATAKGENGLVAWLWLPWFWMAATIALIALGFAPRLREYR
ncbi:hypothetical protein KDK95_17495 [Actinospica sp. MGRD01-02]|uniref:Uncharacterized protein n=1 Tax=Actinospica acidithermotolerans TaxID=2828514 RepID=A0A941IM05_9ACTN|nr:hypothetical protein [Actinospica acidithermotolerans]MBR7828116.1 hypothetical protein [Actinospica acidithermotolerans]